MGHELSTLTGLIIGRLPFRGTGDHSTCCTSMDEQKVRLDGDGPGMTRQQNGFAA